MIKIQNNTPTCEPLPHFLIGLTVESLADLSWTDPALGVSDCVWWPEIDQSPTLSEFERYGNETLTSNPDEKTVTVVRAVVPWTVEEIAAEKQARYDQAMQAIDAKIQVKIRDKYALEDEQYFARIGVGVALGVYEFQEGEREALLEFGQFVESIRHWGCDERAKLAL